MIVRNAVTDSLFGSFTLELDERLCCVLMPFREPFDWVWRETIQPVVREAGFQPRRADDIYHMGPIVRQVWESIVQARVMIADLGQRNPNVFYGLGLAHAIEKEVALLTQDTRDVPFDVGHPRAIQYDPTPAGRQPLADRLRESLNVVLQTYAAGVSASFRSEASLSVVRDLEEGNWLQPTPFLRLTFKPRSFRDGMPVEPAVEVANVGQELGLNCQCAARAVWEGPPSDGDGGL